MERYSSATCEIKYHIIWCTKYRKEILKGEVGEYFKNIISVICESKNWKIIEQEIMPDHIHIFISAPPYDAPTNIVRVLKGVSARQMYKRFSDLKYDLRKGHIWSPSYYVGTAGNMSAETIKKYIQNQTKSTVAFPPPLERSGLHAQRSL